MYTEHTLVFESPVGIFVRQTREVFTTRDGRVLGTDTTLKMRWGGWNGWTVEGGAQESRAFEAELDATAWMDEMFAQHDVEMAAGTRRAPNASSDPFERF